MPDKSSCFNFPWFSILKTGFYLPQNTFCCRNLIRSHYKESVIWVKNTIFCQHFKYCTFFKKCCCKIFQIPDNSIFCICPFTCKLIMIFILCSSICKITCISSIWNYKYLHIFIKWIFSIEAFLTVSMDLVKCFMKIYTTFFQFYMNKRQSINQYSYIITVIMSTFLPNLIRYLQKVIMNIFFINNFYIFQMSVIKSKVMDMIFLNFSCFFYHSVIWWIKKFS